MGYIVASGTVWGQIWGLFNLSNTLNVLITHFFYTFKRPQEGLLLVQVVNTNVHMVLVFHGVLYAMESASVQMALMKLAVVSY